MMMQANIDDYILCYIIGISSFVGLLEVVLKAYRDETRLWSKDIYPCRLSVKPILMLEYETSVIIHPLLPVMESTKALTNPNDWAKLVRKSFNKICSDDAKVIIEALQVAQSKPIKHFVDYKKLGIVPNELQPKLW